MLAHAPVHSDPDASLDLQYKPAWQTSSLHVHALLFTTDPSVYAHAPVHSDPDASSDLQYWLAAHTSSSHVHAPVGSVATSTLGATSGAAYNFVPTDVRPDHRSLPLTECVVPYGASVAV